MIGFSTSSVVRGRLQFVMVVIVGEKEQRSCDMYNVFSMNDQLLSTLFNQNMNLMQLLCYFVGCTTCCGKRGVITTL